MSLKTHSKFYFGYEVSGDACNIDFKEGAGAQLTAVLKIGSYTLTDFVSELSRALNAIGTQTYTVSVDRTTRFITISAASAFTLLIASGTHLGTTAYGVAGFTGADTGSGTSHTGGAAGSSYSTQFILQSHIDPADFQDVTYGTVNKSASGKVEVMSYGTESFMQGDFRYINNFDHGSSAPIRYNPTGIENLRTFMQYLVTKAPVEFMADETNPGSFISLLLESTPDDQNGLKYKLKEMYSQNLPGYFETGPLVFRVLNE